MPSFVEIGPPVPEKKIFEGFLPNNNNNDNNSNRKAMNRNWSNRKANSALKTKAENKWILQIDKVQ